MSFKSGLISVLRQSGLAAPIRRRLGGIGVLLLLHEIHDDVRSELMTGCSPVLLAEVVSGLRRERLGHRRPR